MFILPALITTEEEINTRTEFPITVNDVKNAVYW